MRIIAFLTHSISIAVAAQRIEHRQAQTTPAPDSPFSGNAAQLISLYVPSSAQSLFYAVYTSVESTTGDPASVIESAFTAVTPPAWLEAVPTEYQSNVEALQSAVESLRVAATGGVGASASATGSEESASFSGSESSASSGASTLSGGEETSVNVPPRQTPSFNWGPSSSDFAIPTRVPIAAAGVAGFVGAVLAL